MNAQGVEAGLQPLLPVVLHLLREHTLQVPLRVRSRLRRRSQHPRVLVDFRDVRLLLQPHPRRPQRRTEPTARLQRAPPRGSTRPSKRADADHALELGQEPRPHELTAVTTAVGEQRQRLCGTTPERRLRQKGLRPTALPKEQATPPRRQPRPLEHQRVVELQPQSELRRGLEHRVEAHERLTDVVRKAAAEQVVE